MSADMEQRLREAFEADARRARLVNPDAPRVPEPRVLAEAPATTRRHGPALRFAAAVAAAAVLVAAIVSLDRDASVDTAPSAPLPQPMVRTVRGVGQVVSGSGCPFAISGAPLDVQAGSSSGRFMSRAGQGTATVVVGAQTAEVHVPGMPRPSELGGREEPVALDRGPAMVWLDGPESPSRGAAVDLPYVQVGFRPDGQAAGHWWPEDRAARSYEEGPPCSSFTVTVDGGTEAENRALAVDLADRLVLPAEMPDVDLPGREGGPIAGLELAGTQWAIQLQYAVAPVSFTDRTITWEDRCGQRQATYEVDREEGFLIITDRVRPEHCPPVVASEIGSGRTLIEEVMRADRIAMSLIEGSLILGEGEKTLFLDAPAPVRSGDGELPVTLPPPGEQPDDAESADAEVRAAFIGLFDASVPREDRVQFVDRPDVWLDFNERLFESEYGPILSDLHAVVDEVVFTSPTHASVRFQLLASDERVPSSYHLGDALLVDGRWLVDVLTPCRAAAATGLRCDLTP